MNSVAMSRQRQNKALHPTAYSLRFGRSSRRFGFRRRVSLVVRRLRAVWSQFVLYLNVGRKQKGSLKFE